MKRNHPLSGAIIIITCLLAGGAGCHLGPARPLRLADIRQWEKNRQVDELIYALRHGRPEIRQAAARALGELGQARAAEALVAALGDKQPAVRKAAIKALGKINDPWSLEALVATLRDSDASVRQVSAWVLPRTGWRARTRKERAWFFIASLQWDKLPELGTAASGPLSAVLRDDDSYIRKSAARALGQIGWQAPDDTDRAWFFIASLQWDKLPELGAAAVEPLLGVLDDKLAQVRLAAAQALGGIKDLRAVRPLLGLLDDPSAAVRLAAIKALGSIGDPEAVDPLIDLLQDENPAIRVSTAETLARLRGPQSVVPLVRALRDEDLLVREAVARALAELDWQPGNEREKAAFFIAARQWDKVRELKEAAAGELLARLADPNRKVRRNAAEILEKIAWRPKNDRERACFLIAALRWEQVERLGAAAVEPLVRVLQDEDPRIREMAARTLERTGDVRAVKPLIEALRNKHSLQILGERGQAQTVNLLVLLAALKDKDPDARYKALKALGALADLRSLEPIISALEDDNPRVREAAAEALGKIADPRAVKPLLLSLKDRSPAVRKSVARALEKSNANWRQAQQTRQAVPLFISSLKNPSAAEREGAAEALGIIRDVRGVRPLIDVLADEQPGVRKAAAWALGRIGDARAVRSLRGLLADPDEEVRARAGEALKKLGYSGPGS